LAATGPLWKNSNLFNRRRVCGEKMSTRATYQFKSKEGFNTTFYIHHDGYPEGAAQYLVNMLNKTYLDKVDANTFFRANEGTELTKSHDYHGDTEYRYTIDSNGIVAEEVIYDDSNDARTKIIFTGSVGEFINKHLYKGKKIFRNINGQWLRKTTLTKLLKQQKNTRDAYKTKFPTHAGNISSLERQVEEAEELIKQYRENK
jgi:hypothetical protein